MPQEVRLCSAYSSCLLGGLSAEETIYSAEIVKSCAGFKICNGTAGQFLKADGTTDSSAYTTCAGTVVAGDISSFTSCVGTVVAGDISSFTSCVGTVVAGDISSFTSCTGTTTPTSTETFTNKSGNNSQWTNDAGFTCTEGTITQVTAGDGMSGGASSGNASVAVDSTVVRTTGAQSVGGVKTFTSDLCVTGASDSNLFVIDVSGDGVGIGCNNPGTYKLNVAGGIRASGTVDIANNAGTRGLKADNTPMLVAHVSTSDDLIINGTPGVEVPTRIQGDYITIEPQNFLGISSEAVRVIDGGNVGIGTTVPGSKLTVAGAISATGSINTYNNFVSAGVNIDQLFGSGGISSGTACKLTKYNAAGTDIENSIVTESSSLITIAGALSASSICANDTFGNIIYGNAALNSNTTGGMNVAIGDQVMVNATTAADNVAIGRCAVGSGIATGSCNVAIGFQVMQAVTTAFNNTAVGTQSMAALNTGEYNTGIGFKTLNAIVGGDRNSALGANAGKAITSGCDNVAVGFRALCGAVTGNNNVAIGRESMKAVVTGNDNVAIGKNALESNTSGTCNVAMGGSLKGNKTGSYNTSIGDGSMFNALSGDHNFAAGQYALYDNYGGDYNVAMGPSSMQCNSVGSNNTAIGHQSLFNNTAGNDNTAVGECSMKSNVNGIGNTALGYSSLAGNATGNYNIAIGDNAGSFWADGCTYLSGGDDSMYIGRNTRAKNNLDYNSVVVGLSACSCGANTTTFGNTTTTHTVLHGDAQLTQNGCGLLLKSASGCTYCLTVNDAGTISTTLTLAK